MRKNHTSLTKQMSQKGFKLRTWARSKGLSEADYNLLLNMSFGQTKGVRGRAKELKELLEKEGFEVA
ncbi:hypothetical protein DMB92_08565 [Campylobacter sp. MIT 99-7217]|uniref:hypothetical protein n=1 Tax=Campylobacter sp. MIT 99-7217 TaxID=535091 RepID=UPI0011579E41|nr:hypothetical protein [Campylobacter sp. MIT 99-7217]TQR29180.1 hypothetical protein DMB92_08565 [Campylobacter sp. MIT 99-7217]